MRRQLRHGDLATQYLKPDPRMLNTIEEKAELASRLANALAKDHPILAGLNVDASFYDAAVSGLVPLPRLPTFSPIGRKALVIVGYGPYNKNAPNSLYFKALNSWGLWGDKGFLYLPAEYILNANVFQAEYYEIYLDAPHLVATASPSTQEVQLGVNGLPGQSWALQASANLVHWEDILLFTLTQESTNVAVPMAPEAPAQFFRGQILGGNGGTW